MRTFVHTIYQRVLQSKAVRQGQLKMDQPFLTSFFKDHFDLDKVPHFPHLDKQHEETQCHHLSEETLRRWCQLIELLASRGASVHSTEFGQMIPLQYALQIGRNTFKVIS